MSTAQSLSYATMGATEAAEKTIAAATSATTASTGFDLINHAIRMGASRTVSAPLPAASVEAAQATSNDASELLLKAHLLDRAAASGATNLSRVSSSSLSPILSHHELAASQPAAYAELLRQQFGGSSGLLAALQRRHQPTSLSEFPAGLSLQLATYLGAAAAAAAPGTKAAIPPSTSPTTVTTQDQRQSQDEQNARQLNPNAFQFPWKLHDMLDRASAEGYDNVVSWVEDGEAFRVHLPDVFVENVMSRFFKQTKYKSFQRQLNLYGFTRLHNGPNKGGYKHKYFRQGQRTLCQLITRSPIRDSSSAAAAMAAATASSEDSNTRMIAEKETTPSVVASTLPHATSSVSMSSKDSASLQPKQAQATQATTPAGYHQAAAAMLAARQQALTSSFHLMEKARQEQQLQQLQLQQYEAQRLQQLKLQQQQREITVTSSYVPGMPLAGTDHSAHSSVATRKISLSSSSGSGPATESSKGVHQVLDTSSNSSLTVEAPGTPRVSDKEKLSMFHKEFQFPWKLYEMLERADEDEFASLVSWMPGDSSFKVHDTDNFVKEVMPRFFKQTKYKSFQRQLNLYGFIRVDMGPNKGGYRHPNFKKGRKDLLVNINRIKIKGNGRPRSDRSSSANVIEADLSHHSRINRLDISHHSIRSMNIDTSRHSSRSIKLKKLDGSNHSIRDIELTSAKSPDSAMNNPENISGIAVILKAIKEKESKEAISTAVSPSPVAPARSTEVVSDVPDNTSDSNSTIPSTIDVQMKDSSSDTKNGSGLSWRQHPSESFSDWTIEIIEEDKSTFARSFYHVHRRVLAVGAKKSDYFANIFKSNGSANRSQLNLSKKEAAVFPLALDYIYADVDFDLDTEKAYALYSLGERLENASIVQTVADFYSKWCMTKRNVVEFLKLGQTFQNKALLEAAVLKCSQEIWSMDVESASKIDPGLLLQILRIATTTARSENKPEYDSIKLSKMVALSVSHASTANLTLDIFRSLTSELILPTLEPIAAIELLATENTLLSVGTASQIGDSSFHGRCVSAIQKHWDLVRKRLSESPELADAMKSIPSMVLYELLMKTTASSAAISMQS